MSWGFVIVVVVVIFSLPFNELNSPGFVGMLGGGNEIFQLAWDLHFKPLLSHFENTMV